MKVRYVFAVAIALVVALFPGIVSASSGWQITTTTNPGGNFSGISTNELAAVSCFSTTSCTAVGYYFDYNTNLTVTLAEYWNGAIWQTQSTPNPAGAQTSQLSGVKCISATFCTAVGYYYNSSGEEYTLAESWNGTSWSIQPTANPGPYTNQLNAIGCPATTNCTAVGTYVNSSGLTVTLAEHWNGTTWTVQPMPATTGDGDLLGISCTVTGICTAVGSQGAVTLAERWNGSSWKVQSTPTPAGAHQSALNGVKCTSAKVCMAVGYSSSTLAERWNGTSWKVISTPSIPGGFGHLTAVSCTTASVCTAVGYNGGALSLAEGWNGTAWQIQSTPNPDAENYLLGVSCSTATACTAVGDEDGGTGSSPVLTLGMNRS